MADSTQTYKNHASLRPAYHYFVLPVLLTNALLAIRSLVQAPSLDTTWAFIVAFALLTLAFVARVMALTVQDRVIRLEMRLRLRETLPPDLKARIYELTPRQLVAMRFASDQEMPELMREVLAGNLASPKAIKTRVKNWQADYLRA